MSLGDKAKDVTQKVAGKVEEAVGKKTDDAELTHQGQKDQVMGVASTRRRPRTRSTASDRRPLLTPVPLVGAGVRCVRRGRVRRVRPAEPVQKA